MGARKTGEEGVVRREEERRYVVWEHQKEEEKGESKINDGRSWEKGEGGWLEGKKRRRWTRRKTW